MVLTILEFLILCHSEGFTSNLVCSKYDVSNIGSSFVIFTSGFSETVCPILFATGSATCFSTFLTSSFAAFETFLFSFTAGSVANIGLVLTTF